MASLARYLLNEADNGTSVATVIDDASDCDLTVSNASAGEWEAITSGRGIRSLLAARSSSSLRLLSDPLNTTTIGGQIGGLQKFTLAFAINVTAGEDLDGIARAYLVHIGETNEVGLISVGVDGSGRVMVFLNYDGTDDAKYLCIPPITSNGYMTLFVSVDTTEAAPNDRVKIYINSILVFTLAQTAIPLNATINTPNTADDYLTLFNRRSANRNPQGAIYYFEMFDEVFTQEQINDINTQLQADNDSALSILVANAKKFIKKYILGFGAD